jgi:hypothetical protein
MSNSLIPSTFNDGFNVKIARRANTLINGGILKYSHPEYKLNGDNIGIPKGRYIPLYLRDAWVLWENNKPAEHRITPDNGCPPMREELGCTDESQWPKGQNGQPTDPWKFTYYLGLINQGNGAEVTFITDTLGGCRAIEDLQNQIANVRAAHPEARAIIELGTAPWKLKGGIKSTRPNFNVVDWVQGRGNQKLIPGTTTTTTTTTDDDGEPPWL